MSDPLLEERSVANVIAREDTRRLKFLVGAGLNIDARDSTGTTVLIRAVRQERMKMIRCLLRLHADANACNSQGRSPLYYAIHGQFKGFLRQQEIITLLFSVGGQI